MKKFFNLFLLLLSAVILTACSKDSEPENLADQIVDPELREILVRKFDTNLDYRLSKEEVNAVEELNIGDSYKIRSFQGIEMFTNLKKIILSRIEVESIDFSKCLKLRRVEFFSCPDINTIYLPISLRGTLEVFGLPYDKIIYK